MNTSTRNPLLMWWIIWAALLLGVFQFHFFLAKAHSPKLDVEGGSQSWLVALSPLALSCALRWFVLPWISSARIALPIFVFGIALAEMTCFLGLFLFPEHEPQLFMASAVGIFQFIPYYVGRYYR